MKKRQVAILGAAILCAAHVGYGANPVEIVKHGTLEFDTSVEVGKALDGYKYFKKTKWTSFETKQGRTIVEFTALMDLDAYKNAQYGTQFDGFKITEKMVENAKLLIKNRDIEYVAQFQLSKADNTFKLSHSAMKMPVAAPANATQADLEIAILEVKDEQFKTLKCIFADKPEVNTVAMLMAYLGAGEDMAKQAQAAAAEQKAKAAEQAAAAEKRKALIAKIQTEIAELKNQINSADADEKKEMEQNERQIGSGRTSLQTDVKSLLAQISEARKQVEAVKQQHDPAKKQLDDLNGARNAFASRWTPFIEKARTNSINAQGAANKFHADYLTAAAKLVNDAVQYRHLSIKPLPADGKFSDAINSTTEAQSNAVSIGGATVTTTEREVGTEFAGELFENKDVILNVGNWIVHSRPGDFMGSRDGSLLVVSQVSTKPTGNEIRYRNFVRFPKALDDARVRQSFYMMYWRFGRDFRSYEVAARTAQGQLTAAEDGLKSDLQKWDAQNGARLTPLQNQVSTLSKQIAELNSKLTEANTTLSAKEKLLNKPEAEQIAGIRQEISARYAEKKRPLTEQLTKLEAKLKESASQ
jgi:hypothetical protein